VLESIPAGRAYAQLDAGITKRSGAWAGVEAGYRLSDDIGLFSRAEATLVGGELDAAAMIGARWRI
jgi:hypothetical protein